MRGKDVSAFRERGLRGVSRAEPQCLVVNLNKERKANTMKTCILGKYKVVEPQKSVAPAAAGPILFLGLDVHNDSIAVSIAPSDSVEVRRYGIIGGSHEDVFKLCKKLQGAHPEATLKFCYEAGPRGYPLGRFLQGHGYDCILVCPSKVQPLKPQNPF